MNNNNDEQKDVKYNTLNNDDPEQGRQLDATINSQNNDQDPNTNTINIRGYAYNPHENMGSTLCSDICFRGLNCLLFFIFTRPSHFTDNKCQMLIDYSIYYIYFNIAMACVAILGYFIAKAFKSFVLIGIDYSIRFFGVLVFMIMFQIAYVNSSNCGGLAILVLFNLISFYLVVAILLCAVCCFCCVAIAAVKASEDQQLINTQNQGNERQNQGPLNPEGSQQDANK